MYKIKIFRKQGNVLLVSLIFLMAMAWGFFTVQTLLISENEALYALSQYNQLKSNSFEVLNEIQKNVETLPKNCFLEQEDFSVFFKVRKKSFHVLPCHFLLHSKGEADYWIESFTSLKQRIFYIHLDMYTPDKRFLQAMESVIVLKNEKNEGEFFE